MKDTPAIGFHITGAFDKILPIEKCWLMDDLHNHIRNAVRNYAIEHSLSFFDLRQQVGFLRDVIIRNSNSGEWMVIGDQDIKVFKGKDFIIETMEDLKFKVGPKSFYQTNTEQAYHLYSVAREFAGLTGNEFVYDLYTGTGTIANFVAKKARQVIGIEYIEWHREHLILCRRYERHPDRRLYQSTRATGRHHYGPASCRHAS